MTSVRHPVTVARAEALFTSAVPTGVTLSRTQLQVVVSTAVRSRGSVRACAAEMAAAYGECPEAAASRMRWALRTVELAGRRRP
jgi:hypothetical protein